MYRCICHTCDAVATFRDLEAAQTAFNDHAERRHEVVLQRDDSRVDPVDSSVDEGGPSTDSIADGFETDDSDRIDG